MKNGFTYQGFELDGRGGSFARRQSTMQYGVQAGDFASYLAIEAAGDNGYRKFSGSQIERLTAMSAIVATGRRSISR